MVVGMGMWVFRHGNQIYQLQHINIFYSNCWDQDSLALSTHIKTLPPNSGRGEEKLCWGRISRSYPSKNLARRISQRPRHSHLRKQAQEIRLFGIAKSHHRLGPILIFGNRCLCGGGNSRTCSRE